MKKLVAFLPMIFFIGLLACEKEELDPSLPPIIETTSSVDAESKISQLVNEGRNLEFLVDLQDDIIWKACYSTANPNNIFAYGIEAHIIVESKQKKVDKKLRTVITIWDEDSFTIYGESNYMSTIYNKSTIRFYKVSASESNSSPNCNSLKYYFTSAQPFGGSFVK
jgi:hypothetical protein